MPRYAHLSNLAGLSELKSKLRKGTKKLKNLQAANNKFLREIEKNPEKSVNLRLKMIENQRVMSEVHAELELINKVWRVR